MDAHQIGRISSLALVCGMALSPIAAAPDRSQALAPADAKQQVLQLENLWVTAEQNHDAAALRRILDDKFVATFDAGKLRDKEAFIKAIVSGAVDPTESQTLTDETVIIDQDTAVVVGTDTLRGTNNGAPYTTLFRYTTTYLRRQGHWIALAEHLVEAPQPK